MKQGTPPPLCATQITCCALCAHTQAKERQLERAEKALEAARQAEAEQELRQASAEEAVRKMEGGLGAARQRVAQVEAAGKAREREVEKLQRLLDQTKTSEVGGRCAWCTVHGPLVSARCMYVCTRALRAQCPAI